MIKRRSLLEGLEALSLGLGAACLALGCGADTPAPAGEETPSLSPPPESGTECDENPYLEDCPPAEGGSATPAGAGGSPPVATQPPAREPTQEELLRDQVQNILLANCGSCHGTQLNERTARAGMNYINDLAKLEQGGQIVPLDAEGSPIIRRMRDGSMPPPAEGGQRVPTSDIDFVAAFINNPDFWEAAPRVTCDDNPPLSFDALYEAVARDLRAQDAEDREFLRYVSLDNRAAAGVCTDTALDLDRQGLTKLVNMLSIDATIVRPEVVNSVQTLFRIDLRDLKWDRGITVNGQAFDDVWEAIIGFNAYAVPFVGDAADDARADALTDVPVMFLDSLLDVAAIGNLYYAIIDVDVEQSLDDFVSNVLGIDVAANLEEENLIRAGTTRSRISRQDRLIEGHRIEVRAGVYYQSFDFDDAQNESIFQDPFGFNEGGREAIFTLPNGMFAYLIADEDGALVEDSDILLDTSQNNYRAITSISCSNCHQNGLLPVQDEVRDVVLQNAVLLAQDGTLDRDQLEQLEQVYLEPAEFERRLEQDTSVFYQSALRQASLPLNGTDPVSSVFLRFDRDMGLREAAADLGLSADQLSDALNLLDPALGVLRRGTIDRDDFTALYLESLCIVSAVNDNRPDDALCDGVLGD